jgi:hypothetical protein
MWKYFKKIVAHTRSVRYISVTYRAFLFLFVVTGCYNLGCHYVSITTSVDMFKIDIDKKIEFLERYGKSARGKIGDIPVLVLRGNYEEIGEAHGVLAGRDIVSLLDSFLIPYVNRIQSSAWDEIVFNLSKSFRFPESYEKELCGIYNGIKIKYPNIADRMLSSLNREIIVEDLRALNCFVDIFLSRNNCSSFSAWGSLTDTGDVICGRNLDERYIPGKPPFMVIARGPSEPGRLSSMDIIGPGLICSSTPMNASGVVLMVHDSIGFPVKPSDEWVPRALVVREAVENLEANFSMEKIQQLFGNRNVREGCNTHVAFPLSIRSTNSQLPFVIEWDGSKEYDGVSIRLSGYDNIFNVLICTNHFIERKQVDPGMSKGSMIRYHRIANTIQTIKKTKQKINIENAMKIMDSVSENGSIVTYLSAIIVPNERKMIIALSPGNGISATKSEWIEIELSRILGSL